MKLNCLGLGLSDFGLHQLNIIFASLSIGLRDYILGCAVMLGFGIVAAYLKLATCQRL
jgi:hypothetical protein